MGLDCHGVKGGLLDWGVCLLDTLCPCLFVMVTAFLS